MRKTVFLLSAILCFSISTTAYADALSTNTASSTETDAESLGFDISGFREYSWGEDFDYIKDKEITSDMKDIRDYEIDNSDDLTSLTIRNGEVAGYEGSVSYIFSDNKLECGAYDISVDEDNFDDLVEKYTSVYGEPLSIKESTGWGKCALYADSQKNIICISEIINIVYLSYGASYTSYLSGSLNKFHEIDLEKELEKIGNISGI